MSTKTDDGATTLLKVTTQPSKETDNKIKITNNYSLESAALIDALSEQTAGKKKNFINLEKLLVTSSSFRKKQMDRIKSSDVAVAMATGRLFIDRRLSPSIDETHPFKNKKGPLMTKRNKRLNFFLDRCVH